MRSSASSSVVIDGRSSPVQFYSSVVVVVGHSQYIDCTTRRRLCWPRNAATADATQLQVEWKENQIFNIFSGHTLVNYCCWGQQRWLRLTCCWMEVHTHSPGALVTYLFHYTIHVPPLPALWRSVEHTFTCLYFSLALPLWNDRGLINWSVLHCVTVGLQQQERSNSLWCIARCVSYMKFNNNVIRRRRQIFSNKPGMGSQAVL